MATVVYHVVTTFWLVVGLFERSFFIWVRLYLHRYHFILWMHFHLAILSALLLDNHLKLLTAYLGISHPSIRLAAPLSWWRLALLLISI